MKIRLLEKSDYQNNFLTLLAQLTTVGKITQEEFEDTFDLPNRPLTYVVENDKGKLVATASLVIEQKFIHGCSRVGHIEDVVVDEYSRGLGLGKLIIEHLVEVARKNKCYKVILDCNENNVPFYQKCGFKPKEIEMVQYLD